METIYSDHTVSISEFKKNPGRVMASAQGRPVAVLKNNKPGFYAVPSELFEHIAELLDDLSLADTVRQRLQRGHAAGLPLRSRRTGRSRDRSGETRTKPGLGLGPGTGAPQNIAPRNPLETPPRPG